MTNARWVYVTGTRENIVQFTQPRAQRMANGLE